MDRSGTEKAAALLWQTRIEGRRIDSLPADCRPFSLAEGYAIQDAMVDCAKQKVVGWKIAATSVAGQRHIGVTEPLAGRLFEKFMLADGARRPARPLHMKAAEAEFAFKMARDLKGGERDYSMSEVVDAVAALHLAIEIPDARFERFAEVGPALIAADDAYASWFVFGRPVDRWRDLDLPTQAVRAVKNGALVAEGSGANALGDPRVALTWLANHLARSGPGLKAGDVIISGTCVKPVDIAAGDTVIADFGALGTVTAGFD